MWVWGLGETGENGLETLAEVLLVLQRAADDCPLERLVDGCVRVETRLAPAAAAVATVGRAARAVRRARTDVGEAFAFGQQPCRCFAVVGGAGGAQCTLQLVDVVLGALQGTLLAKRSGGTQSNLDGGQALHQRRLARLDVLKVHWVERNEGE